MKKFYFLVVLMAIILPASLILAGCGGATPATTAPSAPASSPTATPPATIKIGHIIDLTGPEAMVGKLMQSSLKFAFDSVNNQIAGHPIEIIIGDAKGDPATATDVARKMVENDKVSAIFGPTGGGEKVAVAGYISRVGVPNILYNVIPDLSSFAGNKWVVCSGGTDPAQGTSMADYIYNHLNYRSITTITQDNNSGEGALNPLIEAFEKLGGEVVQSQWVPVPCSDFAPYFSSLKPADAVVAWDSGSDAILFLSQFHELGIDKNFKLVGAFHGGFLDPFIINALPPEDAAATVGVTCPMQYAPDSQSAANKAFIEAFTAAVGFPPGDDGVTGPYQAAMLFIKALEATNADTTPSTLIDAILKTRIDSIEGPQYFEGSSMATKNVYIVQVTEIPHVPGKYAYKTVYTYNEVPPTGYVGNK